MLFLSTSGLAAQTAPPASPFLTSDHWSYRVLRRLDNAGLLPAGADVARRTIPEEEIAALLEAAHQKLPTAYLEHFRSEFSAARPHSFSVPHRETRIGYRTARGQFAPGIGYDSLNWSGARALADDTDEFGGVRFSATLTRYVALGVMTDNDRFEEAQLVGSAGIVGAWLGRRELGYATGVGGGLILNPHTFDGAGVFLTRPLRLPLLGPLRFEMHVSQVDNVLNYNGEEFELEPWFWTARGSFEPVANLRVGITRGMMFGGEGNVPVTFSRLAKNLIGIYAGDEENSFANQILSADLRYRVPGLPASLYLEWGTDDAAGAGWDVPGILGGIEVVHVDSSYDAAIGFEHAQFSRSCCSNSIWYRNAWFRGSWADGEADLGHPLGGHGREWRVFANAGFADAKVLLHATLFSRRRRAENIFVPAWGGQSNGFSASAELAPFRNARIELNGEVDRGTDDWTASHFSAALRYRF